LRQQWRNSLDSLKSELDQIQLADFSPHSRKLISEISAGLSEASKQIGINRDLLSEEIAEIEQSLAIINSSIYEITKGVS
jgi:predicted  nucleic acid-binding Zn-ribbon protein